MTGVKRARQYAHCPSGGDYFNGSFNSREEAIDDAILEEHIELGEILQVGVASPFHPFISADTLFEELQNQAIDECGEAAEEWPNVTQQQQNKFEEAVNKLFMDFLEEAAEIPEFFSIDSIEEILITQEMIDDTKARAASVNP